MGENTSTIYKSGNNNMRRLFFALIFCTLFLIFSPLSAQKPGHEEPHFSDAVEVLSVENLGSPILPDEEKVIYDGLVASMHIIRDDEHRAIRTTDGNVYPWPDSFDLVSVTTTYDFQATLIYEDNIFLQSVGSPSQKPNTYWTLNLVTGIYTQRAANTVSTFCGEIPPSSLIKEWVFKMDEHGTRLCSPYRQIVSSPLPSNYIWLTYEEPSAGIIAISPSKNTIVFVGYVDKATGGEDIFFRYDVLEDKVTILGPGSMYHNSRIDIQWLTDEIVLSTTFNSGANTIYGPVLNLIDLRYNDVTVIKGATPYTQENQINVSNDPLQIIVNDVIYINLVIGDTETQHSYCRDTIYDVLNRAKQLIEYGEFCHFVGGQRPGVGYYLLNRQLWRYQSGESSTGYRILDKQIKHIQLWGDNLLIYTDDQVLQLDTTATNAIPEVFFDHPALELVASASTITPTNPFHYFITAEGLLRVNVKTGEQVLLFEGRVSQVKWIDVDRGFAALIYQEIVDNFPPYISPTINDVDPWGQPNYSQGKAALVNLKTGKVIFEMDVEWDKQREWNPGYWQNANITDWGHGRFQPERSTTIYIVSPEGKIIKTIESSETFRPLLRADDWILVQNTAQKRLTLFNPSTDESILLATDIVDGYSYKGNGEFELRFSNNKVYTIRVSQLVH
jgi:hypothetical protein